MTMNAPNWEFTQTQLKKLGKYAGTIDNDPGAGTWTGLLAYIGLDYSPATLGQWAIPMKTACADNKIDQDADNLAMFLMTVIEESGGFTRLQENLNYSTWERLHAVWPSRFPDQQSAKGFVNNPKALAIKVYGGRGGNAPGPSTDGYDFRGTGPMMLTFRAYFQKHADHFKMPLADFMKWILTPAGGSESAAFYWSDREGLFDAACRGDLLKCTTLVNGGLTNLKMRQTIWARAKQVLVP